MRSFAGPIDRIPCPKGCVLKFSWLRKTFPRFPLQTTKQKASFGFISSFLEGLWDYLDVSDSPEPSDVIFVLAGRSERKIYGLQLFNQNLAPWLILSVGRYEVRP